MQSHGLKPTRLLCPKDSPGKNTGVGCHFLLQLHCIPVTNVSITLLELTPQKDFLFIIGDWNVKVGSQETPGITGKFGLGVQNEAGQRLTEFCQENAQVIANTVF